MKALSIKQPWANLILHGGKDIENRSWTTRQRGTILIHASQGMTRKQWAYAFDFSKPMVLKNEIFNYHTQQRGGIVGMVDIVDCVNDSASPWYMGEVGFVLANPRPLPFTPYKGRLGFFEVPDHLVAGLDLKGTRT
jgi:hypothetical protein